MKEKEIRKPQNLAEERAEIRRTRSRQLIIVFADVISLIVAYLIVGRKLLARKA